MKKIVSSIVISTMLLISIMGYMLDIKVYAQVDEITFSQQGGFYTQPFELYLSASDSTARIYYTTDGSEPSPGVQGTYEYTTGIQIRNRTQDPNVISMIRYEPPRPNFGGGGFNPGWGFEDPFNPNPWREPVGQVFKGTPIRAMAVSSNGTRSKVITHTYFVDSNMSNRYGIPVISITTDQDSFFHPNTGLFMGNNFENRGRDWERPIHIEFYEADGRLGFAQNAGVRIHGGFTRNFQQKSLRLYARRDYDDQHWFNYNMFPGYEQRGSGEEMSRFKRLILRNSGNDWMETMMRDGMMQSLVTHMSHDIQAFRQTVVFINGEFWGIHNVRERFDGRYVQSHYPDADNERVAMLDVKITQEIDIDEGTEQDLQDYRNNVLNYVRSNDMRRQDIYDTIKTRIDIDSFIDFYASNIYFANTDWPGNNKLIWKYKTDSGSYEPDAPYGLDGRWRFAMKDTDFGFGLDYGGQVDNDTIRHASVASQGFLTANYPEAVVLFSSLLENDEFRREFINRLSDHLNTAFTPDRVNSVIDQLSGNIASAIPEHNNRWNHRIQNWQENVNVLKNFANNRGPYVRQHIQSNFRSDVRGEATININTDSLRGFVRVNSVDINESTPGVTNPSRWSGVYFDGVPITITAIPKEGYEFERWEGLTGVSQQSETITFNPQNNMSITAVFRQKSSTPTNPTVMLGDINGDNRIDSTDYVLLRRYVLGISSIPVEDIYAVADLNLDGKIDSTDCIILRRYLLDIITSLPHY
ncbi:UNVERIFIED_CONTAM: dockerin type I repeat protein [Acetivibrio alkalicellulosi]